jgi:hypothetical protein
MKGLIPLLLLALVVPFAAAAQSTDAADPAPPMSASTDAASDPAQVTQDQQLAAQDKVPQTSPYCLQHTGSLIRQSGSRQRGGRQQCAAIGSAYTRDDLQRTGATDIADALRRLDSSIR